MKIIYNVTACLIFALGFVLVGCQSTPKKYAGIQEGQWKAKALIKDLDQSRSYIVYLNFNAVRDQRARMDVTTAFGTGVASLVVDQKEVRYILLDSKRFYYGPPSAEVMRPILALPFDPRWLNNLLFEEPILAKDWACSRDKSEALVGCHNDVMGLKITWVSRLGDKKTILIEHSKASVQINMQSFKPKVEERANLFTLEPPESFKRLRVR